ncbi:MAG TPA: hypothetical protein VHS59_09135, partial [Bacillota bacterium]|nr:hypothetical protein [Bacillota bacterium]
KFGTLHNLHINNMVEQFETTKDVPGPTPQLKKLGLVAVANGRGLTRILMSLGVDKVVAGGQTSNPSTQDLLDAVTEIPAEKVIILPNNSNIILAAGQAQSLAEKAVEVLPTKTIPQGIAALVAFNPEAGADENLVKMQKALTAVDTVEITYAVRDSQWEGQDIQKDNILGLVNDRINVVGQDVNQVVLDVLQQVVTEEKELVTLYYGEGISEEVAVQLQEQLAKVYPQLEFEVLEGGQPLYYYIISVE